MSNISVDYDVLNQRGSPAWFSDTFANLPTAGFKGRMFISTDTFAFYRDTGTGWDLIGGPGTGTLTGSGVAGQVSYFNGTQTITGNNNLFWDNTNARLGINTNTPGTSLDIHGIANVLLQLNNTTTANSNIAFQNQNVTKWRIGNVYNGTANSFDIFNVTTTSNALSIDNTTNSFSLNGAGIYSGTISLKQNGSIAAGVGYTTLSSSSAGQLVIYFGDANLYAATILNTSLTASRSYTLPNATGTLALTSNLSSYVPYTGATTNVDLGNNALISGAYININGAAGSGGVLNFKQYGASSINAGLGYTGIFALTTAYLGISYNQDGTNSKTFYFNGNSITNNVSRIYTMPDADGTLALTSNLSAYLPLAGGTLTGNLTINPTNTGVVGLDVASNTTRFRSDNLEGNKRQLEIVMGSGTLVQITAKGYLANYGTDLAFYTATTGGVNANPSIYCLSGGNTGFGTGSPTSIGNGYTTLGINGVNGGGLTFMINGASANSYLYTASDGFNFINVTGSYLFYNGGAERMRLTNTGNLLLGTSTDNGSKFQVSGATTISGNLTIGSPTTDPTINLNGDNAGGDSFINFKADAGGTKVQLLGTKNGGTGGRLTFKTLQGGVLTNAMIIQDAIVTIVALGTGTVTATSGVLSAVSDMNLKIEDGYIDNALEKVMNLKARYYYWKKESNLPTNIRQLGFYAQEVNEALGEEVANVPKNENENWGIYDRGMIAMLTKAIQELNEKLKRNNIN